MTELSNFDRQMAAVAFAEAGEPGVAREFLGKGGPAPQAGKAPDQAGKPYGKFLLFGGISLAMYLGLFANEPLVTDVFTRGGLNTAFPVLTAFLFSFIHGAFASNLLTVLGLEARKK